MSSVIFDAQTRQSVASNENPEPRPVDAGRMREAIRRDRQRAYVNEADPLFMKWQRAEDNTTKQDWLDKVEEIKSRFPYPEDKK